MSTQDTDVNKRVAQYVALRDHIAKLDDDHKTKMKPFRETLEKLNNILLGHLNEVGAESIRTESGTISRTERKSASLADPAAFMKYVIENQAYDLMDRKANAVAVEGYIKEHQAPPPGVNFNRQYVAGVRRSNPNGKGE